MSGNYALFTQRADLHRIKNNLELELIDRKHAFERAAAGEERTAALDLWSKCADDAKDWTALIKALSDLIKSTGNSDVSNSELRSELYCRRGFWYVVRCARFEVCHNRSN